MASISERGHRLAFLHGFTQTHHHWHEAAHLIGERVEPRATLAFVDLPGHGLSGAERAGIADAAAELARLVGPATWFGYSMGGRFALHVALLDDSPVERLVLLGATPGIDDEHERAERRRLDEERAERVERLGVDAFLDEWLGAPIFATLPPDGAGREHRRGNAATGLAHSLRTAGTGTQVSLWSRLAEIDVPVLVVAGGLDEKFTEIGRRMVDDLPSGTFASIPGAGHAAHVERPAVFADVVAEWLSTR